MRWATGAALGPASEYVTGSSMAGNLRRSAPGWLVLIATSGIVAASRRIRMGVSVTKAPPFDNAVWKVPTRLVTHQRKARATENTSPSHSGGRQAGLSRQARLQNVGLMTPLTPSTAQPSPVLPITRGLPPGGFSVSCSLPRSDARRVACQLLEDSGSPVRFSPTGGDGLRGHDSPGADGPLSPPVAMGPTSGRWRF